MDQVILRLGRCCSVRVQGHLAILISFNILHYRSDTLLYTRRVHLGDEPNPSYDGKVIQHQFWRWAICECHRWLARVLDTIFLPAEFPSKLELEYGYYHEDVWLDDDWWTVGFVTHINDQISLQYYSLMGRSSLGDLFGGGQQLLWWTKLSSSMTRTV